MIDFETVGEPQAFADELLASVHARIADATTIEVLSTRGDKLLQVMQEEDGQTFVTRSFTDEAVAYVESRRVNFTEAWDAMRSVFSEAGLRIVPSYLLPSVGKYPFTAVSEHLADAEPVINAPTELKIKLAQSLATVIQPNRDGFFISPEMLNKDMFLLTKDETGEQAITLVDTDPHIMPNLYDANDELLLGYFVSRLADIFWDNWCTPEERQEVCIALFKALDRSTPMNSEDFDIMGKVGNAVQSLHMMTNGMDLRDMPMFSQQRSLH